MKIVTSTLFLVLFSSQSQAFTIGDALDTLKSINEELISSSDTPTKEQNTSEAEPLHPEPPQVKEKTAANQELVTYNKNDSDNQSAIYGDLDKYIQMNEVNGYKIYATPSSIEPITGKFGMKFGETADSICSRTECSIGGDSTYQYIKLEVGGRQRNVSLKFKAGKLSQISVMLPVPEKIKFDAPNDWRSNTFKDAASKLEKKYKKIISVSNVRTSSGGYIKTLFFHNGQIQLVDAVPITNPPFVSVNYTEADFAKSELDEIYPTVRLVLDNASNAQKKTAIVGEDF